MRAISTAVALMLGCSEPPPAPIVFHEVTDDRVPDAAQTPAIPNQGLNLGLGVAVGDVDGDGRVDVYLAGFGLYLNHADPLGFRLVAAPSPSVDVLPVGAAFGDFDRDGDLDLVVVGIGGARLFVNDGSGAFTDVTSAAGVAGDPGDVSLSAAWGDLDGDGWPDLAVANYGFQTDPVRDAQPSRIFINRHDGSFAPLTAPLSDPESYVRAMVTAFADFDGDGKLDVFFGDDADVPFFVHPKPRHDLVLLNRGLDASGQPLLVESSAALGLDSPRATMGLAVGDAGHTAGWDLFFADVHAGWLYRSRAGIFGDVTAQSGIDLSGPKGEEWWQWGGVFADLDGNSREDLLVGQSPIHLGYPGTDANGPLLLRDGGGRFTLERYAFGGPLRARAVVLADLDGDGDQDAILAPFFDRFRFFVNDTAPRRFVRVRLEATASAPGAAGAVVTARCGGLTQKRMRVSGGQPYSQSEETLDFAVSGTTTVTVTWPGGAVQTVAGVAPGSTITITESP